ncbi:peptide deformylase [bacterium]|nr:peptide deformylase [bacterium]
MIQNCEIENEIRDIKKEDRMIKQIKHLGEKCLREESKPVETIDPSLKNLVHDMIETMHSANGVGLAPQIGVNLQLAVIELDQKSLVLVNPSIQKSWGREISEEGCLSIPGVREPVQRATNLIVKAKTIEGKPFEFEVNGLLARAVQHELDHLQGILFIDRISKARRLQLKKILTKIEAGESIEEESSS